MAITQTGDRNIWGAVTRAARSAWFGAPSAVNEAPPLVLNKEFVNGVNSDGSAYRQLIGASNAVTIVDGSATSLFTVALPSNGRCGGMCFYTIEASDATDYQALTGMVTYSAVSKVATQTLTITSAAANDAKAVSGGTLTVAFTFVAGTGLGTVKVQPTGSLTESIYTISFTVIPVVGAVAFL